MVCSRLAIPTSKILRRGPGDSVPLGFRGDSLLHVISLPHFLGKVFIQIYSASDTQKKKKKKILSTEGRDINCLNSGFRLSHRSVEPQNIHMAFARVHRRAGLSKANYSDKVLKAPLILNYLAISEENGCGALIFCQRESADISG